MSSSPGTTHMMSVRRKRQADVRHQRHGVCCFVHVHARLFKSASSQHARIRITAGGLSQSAGGILTKEGPDAAGKPTPNARLPTGNTCKVMTGIPILQQTHLALDLAAVVPSCFGLVETRTTPSQHDPAFLQAAATMSGIKPSAEHAQHTLTSQHVVDCSSHPAHPVHCPVSRPRRTTSEAHAVKEGSMSNIASRPVPLSQQWTRWPGIYKTLTLSSKRTPSQNTTPRHAHATSQPHESIKQSQTDKTQTARTPGPPLPTQPSPASPPGRP